MSSTSDPAFDPKLKITNAAALLLARVQPETSTADMAVAVDKATAALRFAADIEMNSLVREKVDHEIEKLKGENATMLDRLRSDSRRNFIIAITPILAMVTFSIAQLLQNQQFNNRQIFDRDQIAIKQKTEMDAALDADLKKFAESLLSGGELSPGSIAALQKSLDSPVHRELARDYFVAILKKTTDPKLVEYLFDRAFPSIGNATFDSSGRANFQRLVDLSRELIKKTHPIWVKLINHNSHPNGSEGLSPTDESQINYTYAASRRVSSAIGRLLALRPRNLPVDISKTYIYSADWQDVNLEGVNIAGMLIVQTNLKNANLAGVTDFANISVQKTAWWEAKSFNSKLFDHLKTTYPYNPSERYGPDSKSVSQSDYDEAVKKIDVRPN